MFIMFILYIPCLALLACLHSAVGAPVRFAKIYGPSEMPSVDGRDAKSFWTQKQRLQNRGHHGGHWVTAFDPYTSVLISREQDCPSATVIEKTDLWFPIVHWTRRPDDSPTADEHWTTYYGKAAGEHTDDDGDTNNSTHKFPVFLLIILIAIFLLVYPRLNFLLVIRGN